MHNPTQVSPKRMRILPLLLLILSIGIFIWVYQALDIQLKCGILEIIDGAPHQASGAVLLVFFGLDGVLLLAATQPFMSDLSDDGKLNRSTGVSRIKYIISMIAVVVILCTFFFPVYAWMAYPGFDLADLDPHICQTANPPVNSVATDSIDPTLPDTAALPTNLVIMHPLRGTGYYGALMVENRAVSAQALCGFESITVRQVLVPADGIAIQVGVYGRAGEYFHVRINTQWLYLEHTPSTSTCDIWVQASYLAPTGDLDNKVPQLDCEVDCA